MIIGGSEIISTFALGDIYSEQYIWLSCCSSL